MKHLAMVAIVTAFSATSAVALEAHYSKDTPASAAKAWAAIGDFCGISAWHPVVEKCELSQKDGATLRLLHLKGGGTVLEQLVEQNDQTMTQTYVILESVLPVTKYTGTLKVLPNGDGATYDWSSSFVAKGVPDEDSIKGTTGIYIAGIDSLVTRTSK